MYLRDFGEDRRAGKSRKNPRTETRKVLNVIPAKISRIETIRRFLFVSISKRRAYPL